MLALWQSPCPFPSTVCSAGMFSATACSLFYHISLIKQLTKHRKYTYNLDFLLRIILSPSTNLCLDHYPQYVRLVTITHNAPLHVSLRIRTLTSWVDCRKERFKLGSVVVVALFRWAAAAIRTWAATLWVQISNGLGQHVMHLMVGKGRNIRQQFSSVVYSKCWDSTLCNTGILFGLAYNMTCSWPSHNSDHAS